MPSPCYHYQTRAGQRDRRGSRIIGQTINTPSSAWQYPLLAWMFV